MSDLQVINLQYTYLGDPFRLYVPEFSAKEGQIVALVGESGCGKTTLLRSIAGLEIPDQGSIVVGGQTLFDRQIFIPPEKRNIGLVFQDYALFPHLTVKKNIEFGIRKESSVEKQKRLEEIMKLIRLEEMLDKYPHELSGGQQQRVALGRALICKPKILLLDEPFSNMDELLKARLRNDLKDLLGEAGTTTILVTHDIRDAFAIAEYVVVLKEGTVEDQGTVAEIQRNPGSDYIRALIS